MPPSAVTLLTSKLLWLELAVANANDKAGYGEVKGLKVKDFRQTFALMAVRQRTDITVVCLDSQ